MTERYFLGMPIDGEVYSYRAAEVPQLNKEEVSLLINEILEFPEVRGLAWTQYTPYFNDGDSCVFGVGEPSICVNGAENPGGFDYGWQEYDWEETGRLWLDTYNKEFTRLIGDDAKNWEGTWPDRTWTYKTPLEDQPNPALFEKFMNLQDKMDSGAMDHALMDLFGDHAKVIIDKESGKVVIEEYSHD